MSSSEASREDRELPASERRLEQAREEGQVPRSRDIAHVVAIGGLMALLMAAGPWLGQQTLELLATGLRFDRAAAFETQRLMPRLSLLSAEALWIVVPVIAAFAIGLGAITTSVGGWNFTLQALEPKFNRLDPLAGFGRLFGLQEFLQHIRVVLLAMALIGCGGYYLLHHLGEIHALTRLPLAEAIGTGMRWIAGGMSMLLGVCVVAAVADVPMQIFKHKSNLKMTREEARQENKESEGDPHVKGERRRRAREMARGRMMAAVPEASVVITNPTHYAVALRYEEGSMRAPVIVALGADHLALKIREIAKASRVPVLESPPLARALYKHGELDGEVPVALYTAVAQVLAWVMRLRQSMRYVPEPQVEVPAGMDPHEVSA